MSKQRYLLILSALLLVTALSAQSTFSLKTDAGVLRYNSENGMWGTNTLNVHHKLTPALTMEISSDLNAGDRAISPHPQKLWHNGRLKLNLQTSGLDVKAEYQNTLYGSSLLMGLYPDWEPLTSQERLMQHQGTLVAAYDAGIVTAEAYGRLKHLRYTPYVLDMSTFELVQQPNTGINDVYYGLQLRAPIIKGLNATLSANHQDGAYAPLDQYLMTTAKAGLDADFTVGTNSHFAAAVNWTYRDATSIVDDRRNIVQAQIRYQQRFSSALSGYVHFVNNAYVNEQLDEVFLLSYYLRAQAQYSFAADPSGGSFLLLGAKYSPENQADAFFAETDYRVWNKLYTGAAVSIQPDQITAYTGKLSFYYDALNDVHILYTHRDNTHKNTETDYLGLGTSFYW